MFFLLVACLGQSLLAQPTFTAQQPAAAAATAPIVPAAHRPAAGVQNTHRVASKLNKPAKNEANSGVHAIGLTKCDMMGDYDIPAQRFDETMQQITHATGCGIQNGHTTQKESDYLSAIPVSAVRGHLSVRNAMLMALKGSRFQVVREKDNMLYVRLRK